MILRRVAVRHLKGIEAATYDDLSDRLNLFRGPNEAGKTTLVEALHFGLFEQSAGVAQHKRDLETWGRTEAPEVEIDLVDDEGEPWRVRKRFLHAPSTELHGRNAVYRGADAERRLRAMLGTRPGNRHGVAPTDLGIWPLLWVRQGEAGAAIKDVLTPDARDRLQQTLSTHTGALAAGAAVVVDKHRVCVHAAAAAGEQRVARAVRLCMFESSSSVKRTHKTQCRHCAEARSKQCVCPCAHREQRHARAVFPRVHARTCCRRSIDHNACQT